MRLIDAEPIIEMLKRVRKDADSPRRDLDLLNLQQILELAPEITPPPNDPLTLEQLREMKMFEWVWIEVIHPSKRQVFRKIESAYYQIFEDYTYRETLCCGWPGLIHEFEYEDYGKTWLAYRRKKENK